MTLSCTKKVQDKLKGIREISPEKMEVNFFNWYLDLITLNRKKYLLCTNSKTLFSFISYFGTKKEAKNIESIFLKNLCEQIIRQIGYDKVILNILNKRIEQLIITKTNSRKVIGYMTDFKNQIGYKKLDFSDMDNSINRLNTYINTIPMYGLNLARPIDYFSKELEELKLGNN